MQQSVLSSIARFLFLALPFCFYLLMGVVGRLGPDPSKVLMEELGEWAMIFLILTLLVTPLSRLASMPVWVRFRRPLGLAAFFYAVLHVLSYYGFILGFSLAEFITEIASRPYIYPGMLALVLLTLLAGTSTRSAQRALGRSWKRLHRSVYLIALLVLLHYLWQLKSLSVESVAYTLTVSFLLLLRVFWWVRVKHRSANPV